MAADDAARSSRRMDLNLYLGLPRAPRTRRPDLGSDLALGTPMLSSSSPSSSAASADAPPLETDPVHPPYSPSRADLVRPPTPTHGPYYPLAPEEHPPYVPPPLPVPEAAPMLADEPEFGFSHAHLGLVGRMDRPSSSTASSSFRPERPRRLICLTGRQSRYFRPRRFRSDLPPLSSEAPSLEDDAGAQPLEPEEPVSGTVEEIKVVAAVGVSGEEATERSKNTAMFECNICFEMAAEPVVTSCGHLFCWPCLYQWLHVHSSHKECPVCKGEVTAGNITPIYGRGNSGLDTEKKVSEDGNASGPKIPPRPHGNRIESFRQQFHHLRPISRRLGEANGILSSWRRILDQHLMNSMSRVETPESIAQESRFSRMTTRLRARRLLREVENPTIVASSASESGPLMSNTFDPPPRHTSSPLSSEGIDLLRQIAFAGLEDSERLTTALSDLRRIARPSQFGASTSSNPPNPESVDGTNVAVPLAADQASNSSTMAVIQEDAAFTETAGEPSNAGSSRSLRRSRRSEALASLDVDGGDLHRNKRRRLN